MSFSNFLNSVTNGVDQVARDISQAFDGAPLVNLFRTGNVVQLISRSSGRALQIVQAPNGQLVVDGLGPADPHATNTHWTVINEGSGGFINPVRLQNNNNFLGLSPLNAYIQMSNAAFADAGTKLRISQVGNFVTLGSWSHNSHHVGICYNGVQKVPSVTTHLDVDSHFEVRLLVSHVTVSTPASVVVVHTK